MVSMGCTYLIAHTNRYQGRRLLISGIQLPKHFQGRSMDFSTVYRYGVRSLIHLIRYGIYIVEFIIDIRQI